MWATENKIRDQPGPGTFLTLNLKKVGLDLFQYLIKQASFPQQLKEHTDETQLKEQLYDSDGYPAPGRAVTGGANGLPLSSFLTRAAEATDWWGKSYNQVTGNHEREYVYTCVKILIHIYGVPGGVFNPMTPDDKRNVLLEEVKPDRFYFLPSWTTT